MDSLATEVPVKEAAGRPGPAEDVSLVVEAATDGRSCLFVRGPSGGALARVLARVRDEARAGVGPAGRRERDGRESATERVGIDYGTLDELAARAGQAVEALSSDDPRPWTLLRRAGIFRARGPAGRVAFLYTGQGSQYVNMLSGLLEREPAVRETLAEADDVMAPLLGRRLSDCLFANPEDPAATARVAAGLREACVVQPAVLTVDVALTRVLAARGYRPDLAAGQSLGEYAALVAAGVLPFGQALEAVSARARETEGVQVKDPGRMAAVLAPLEEVEQVLSTVDGYVVVANYNSGSQSVIGGETAAVERAAAAFAAIGRKVLPLPVTHAFHTAIVAAGVRPLRAVLERLDVRPPSIPVVSNVTGELYPSGPNARPAIIDLLSRQMAEPVMFAKGLRTLHDAGARVFVEVGPKRALQRLADEAFTGDPYVLTLFTNHPGSPDALVLSQAVCGLRTAADAAASEPAPHVEASRADVPTSPIVLRRGEPVVRPPLALCRPTGVTLERGRRVVVVADEGGVALALAHQLEARGVKVLLVERRPAEEELAGWLRAWLDEGPIHGLYWLATLDPEDGDADEDTTFRAARRSRVDLLLAAMRTLLGSQEGRSAFLLAASRADPLGVGRASAMGAAVHGFVRALRCERPDALAKAVALPAVRPGDGAAMLLQETLADPATSGVTCSSGLRLSPSEAGPRTLAVGWDGSPEAAGSVVEVMLPTARAERIVTPAETALRLRCDPAGGVAAGAAAGRGPLLRRLRGFTETGGLRVETNLDDEALLDRGRPAGRVVVPEGLALETLAEAALLLAPGWHVAAVEKAEFRAPLLASSGSRRVEAWARVHPDGADLVAECRLVAADDDGGEPEGAAALVTARVRIAAQPPRPLYERSAPHRCAGGITREEIYSACAHGPAFRVLDGAWRTHAAIVGMMRAAARVDAGEMATEPRLLDLCFQTTEVLGTGRHGWPVEPVGVEFVRLARRPAEANGSRLYAVVRPAAGGPEDDGHTYDARVLDEGGNVYLELSGCRTAAAPAARAEPASLAALRAGIA